MVSFKNAIKNFYCKAFDFKSRATRAEYWWAELYCIIIFLVLAGTVELVEHSNFLSGICLITLLFHIIAKLSLFVRRVHDLGKSGWSILWMYLSCLIPIVGRIVSLLIFVNYTFSKGEKRDNEYGPNPYESGDIIIDSEEIKL